MNAQIFLKERIEEIVSKVKTIQVSYEYFKYSDTHVIEVIPLGEFNSNELYKALENDLYIDFNNHFFPSTLLISTEDSLNRVNNPEWTVYGNEYIYDINYPECDFEPMFVNYLNGFSEILNNDFSEVLKIKEEYTLALAA